MDDAIKVNKHKQAFGRADQDVADGMGRGSQQLAMWSSSRRLQKAKHASVAVWMAVFFC